MIRIQEKNLSKPKWMLEIWNKQKKSSWPPIDLSKSITFKTDQNHNFENFEQTLLRFEG